MSCAEAQSADLAIQSPKDAKSFRTGGQLLLEGKGLAQFSAKIRFAHMCACKSSEAVGKKAFGVLGSVEMEGNFDDLAYRRGLAVWS